MKKWLLGFAAAAIVCAAVYFGREVYINKTTRCIDVLYTSDMHGHALPEKHYNPSDGSTFVTGGFGSLENYLSAVLNPYIILDAGDIFMGTPEGALEKGGYMIALMNAIKYKAAAGGNHELDYGDAQFEKLAGQAEFPFLDCNLVYSDGRKIPYVKPYAVFDVGGFKVGVTAVIEEDLAKVLTGENAARFGVANASSSVQAAVNTLREKCDAVILLSGLGLENDIKLAKSVTGIDVIAGGETHIALKKAIKVGRTLVCEPGWALQYVGKITLRVGIKGVVSAKWSLDKLLSSEYPPTGLAKKILEQYKTDEYIKMDEKTGSASEWILRHTDSCAESPLGNLIADIIRQSAQTDFAFQNLYGIRNDIAPGVVKKKDLASVSPFGNRIVTMKMTGEQVREVMKQSATEEKGTLQISGLRMIFNSSLPKDRRLLNVIVGDEEIDPGKEYTVATNSFVAGGGDGFITFKEGTDVKDTGKTLLDAEIEYFTENSPVKPILDERIIDVNSD